MLPEKIEKRSAERRPALKAASIIVGVSAIDCSVRNMSETGAALDVISPLDIPSKFLLIHVAGRKLCEIVWRNESCIGVNFC
jgi:hypothetical protein